MEVWGRRGWRSKQLLDDLNEIERGYSRSQSVQNSFGRGYGPFVRYITEWMNEWMNENCALLGYYTASRGNFLPTFRDSFPLQGVVETTTDESVMINYYLVGM